jgi:hypothetical protein
MNKIVEGKTIGNLADQVQRPQLIRIVSFIQMKLMKVICFSKSKMIPGFEHFVELQWTQVMNSRMLSIPFESIVN